MSMPIFISILPFVVFITLLLWERISLLKTSVITAVLFTLLGIFYWKMLPFYVYASYGKGILIAFDIFIIVLGAIFFLEILNHLNVIKNISYYLETFSKDYRIQIIILAWFFENFLEGTAGFGVPAAVVVPLLIGIGLSPIRSLIIGLLGNSTSVVFGAAGTPIRVGFAGLETASVPLYSALLNCVGIIVPIFMLWIITSDRANGRKEFFDGLPFAIWAGVAFVIPSILVLPLGQEFPSIIGSVIGLLLVMATTRLGIFVPKKIKKFDDEKIPEKTMSASRAFLPYFLLIILLIIGKFTLSGLGLPISFGFQHFFSFFNPGFAFIAAALIIMLFWKKEAKILLPSFSNAFKGTISPFLVIAAMSSMVQIMTNSGINISGIPSAITILSKVFETPLLPFFAPFVGAFGSFITGSATISNIMFGNFFAVASTSLNLNLGIILSLGVVGAASGNMIALADILAAEAVAKVKNQEVRVIKGVLVPCITYVILLGILGMIITQ